MIDIHNETIIPLRQVGDLKFMQGRGKKLGIATVWRWITHGRFGVKLESISLGAARCTSVEAVERFIMATQDTPVPPTSRTPSQKAKAKATTGKKLTAIFGND